MAPSFIFFELKIFSNPTCFLNRWSGALVLGGSLGLVVMGVDSCSEGRGYESQYCILDGHIHVYGL